MTGVPQAPQPAAGPAARSYAPVFLTVGGYVFVVVLLVGALSALVAVMGYSPGEAIRVALRDSLTTAVGLANALNRMTPLLLAGLTFALGARGGFFNIGLDGQIYAGAIGAAGVGIFLLGEGTPALIGVPLVLLAGAAGAALWALPAALLRIRWGVNEIFTTVMFNFIALHLVGYLSTRLWNDPVAGEAITLPVVRAARLGFLMPRGGAHYGVLFAVAAAVLVWVLVYRTRMGYELRAVGSNPRASLLAGIRLSVLQATALCLGAAFAGLAGAVEVSGIHGRLLLGLTPNYGVTAILIAVVARYHPLALVPAAFAFAVLVAASDSLQRTVAFPSSAVFMVQGLVVLAILAMDALRARLDRGG